MFLDPFCFCWSTVWQWHALVGWTWFFFASIHFAALYIVNTNVVSNEAWFRLKGCGKLEDLEIIKKTAYFHEWKCYVMRKVNLRCSRWSEDLNVDKSFKGCLDLGRLQPLWLTICWPTNPTLSIGRDHGTRLNRPKQDWRRQNRTKNDRSCAYRRPLFIRTTRGPIWTLY